MPHVCLARGHRGAGGGRAPFTASADPCEYNHAMGQAGGLRTTGVVRRARVAGWFRVGSGATYASRLSTPTASVCLPTAATSARRSTTAPSCATVWCRPIVCPIHCWPSSPLSMQPVDVEWAAWASSASSIVVGSPRSTTFAPMRAVEVDGRPFGRGASSHLPPIAPQQGCPQSRAHPCRARRAGPLPSRSPSVRGGPRHGRREARSRRFDSSHRARRRRKTGHERSPGRYCTRRCPLPSTRRVTTSRSDRSGSCRLRWACGAADRQRRPAGSGTAASRPPTGGADGSRLDRGVRRRTSTRGTDHVSTTTYELAVGNVIHRQQRLVLDGAIQFVGDDVTIPA